MSVQSNSPVQPGIAEPHLHLAADHRLVALDQLPRRLLVAGANPPHEAGEHRVVAHAWFPPCVP